MDGPDGEANAIRCHPNGGRRDVAINICVLVVMGGAALLLVVPWPLAVVATAVGLAAVTVGSFIRPPELFELRDGRLRHERPLGPPRQLAMSQVVDVRTAWIPYRSGDLVLVATNGAGLHVPITETTEDIRTAIGRALPLRLCGTISPAATKALSLDDGGTRP